MTTVDMQLDVLTAGEAMMLFAARQTGSLDVVGSFNRTTAGAELNVAIGLARLGLRVGYLSRLGNDTFGRYIAAALDKEGIDRRHVAWDNERATGFMLKSRNDDGSDPQVEYFRRGSAASHMNAGELDNVYCRSARHIHLTGIYVGVSPSTQDMIFDLATKARETGRSISFDPNLRPTLWRSQDEMVACLNRLSTLCDWILPGLSEGQMLTGQSSVQCIADFYLERGAKCVVVKLGAEGAYYANAGGNGFIPSVCVPLIVDTVGAGDGFAVGVISGLLEGLTLKDATVRGNAIGARVVQFPGDSEGLPTRNELNAMLN
jgi:2-dehydro-3-deoxygluconokinase